MGAVTEHRLGEGEAEKRRRMTVWKRTPGGRTIRKRGKRAPFVMLPKYMVTCAAWRSLPALAAVALVEIARRYDGSNNGRLHLSVREFASLRACSKNTAAFALGTLVERGFLEPVRASGFNIKDRKRQAAEYRLTTEHCNVTHQPPSKAFMKWQPEKTFHGPNFRDSTVPKIGTEEKIH